MLARARVGSRNQECNAVWRRVAALAQVFMLMGAVFSSACANPSTIPTATAQSEPEPTPTPKAVLSPSPASRIRANVTDVIDGDTIEVNIGGKSYNVRYIGIDTPETKHPTKGVECYGKEAAAKNKELVANKIVELEKDVSETDRYGRLLRYVYVGDVMVNAELVKEGYAQAITYPPDVKYQALFLKLQNEARQAQRGLWDPANCPAVEAPTPAATAGLVSEAEGEWITSSHGSARYYYHKTDPRWKELVPENRRWFRTVEELLAKYPERKPAPAP